jgi:hypothetical protein
MQHVVVIDESAIKNQSKRRCLAAGSRKVQSGRNGLAQRGPPFAGSGNATMPVGGRNVFQDQSRRHRQ